MKDGGTVEQVMMYFPDGSRVPYTVFNYREDEGMSDPQGNVFEDNVFLQTQPEGHGKPPHIDQDIWDTATRIAMRPIVAGTYFHTNYVTPWAQALQDERERAAGIVDAECARILAAIDGKYPDVDDQLRMAVVLLPDLADAIRNGVPK